ncbi:MAG: uncharacterized protein A8A55_0665 [Amphiamblys sp. WSBS2006]|nr:MAG: uncharacterized protein A8A55_0665 [Amphiamblys sp. WSBS2006]
MQRRENKKILFTESVAESVGTDGSRMETDTPAQPAKKQTPIQEILEQSRCSINTEVYGPAVTEYLHTKNELYTDEDILRKLYIPVSEDKAPAHSANEESVTSLVYGNTFGRNYILSFLKFVKDIDDESFKKAAYAYACDLTHGGIEIMNHIATPPIPEKEETQLETTLRKNEKLFEYWAQMQDARKQNSSDEIGIEESLLSRRLYQQLLYAIGKTKERDDDRPQ